MWTSVTTYRHARSRWSPRRRAARARLRRATISQGRRPPARPTQIAPPAPALRRWIVTTCRDPCSPSRPAARPPASPTTAPSADRTGISARISAIRRVIRPREIPRTATPPAVLYVPWGPETSRISRNFMLPQKFPAWNKSGDWIEFQESRKGWFKGYCDASEMPRGSEIPALRSPIPAWKFWQGHQINLKSLQFKISSLAACITIPGFQIEFGRSGLRCAPTASSSVIVAVPTQYPHTEDPDATATLATDLRCTSQQGTSAGAGLRPRRSAEVAERGIRRDSEATGLREPRLENAPAIGRHPYGPEAGCS